MSVAWIESSVPMTCLMFDTMLPWLSMAARGEPAVPLVNMSTARWLSATSTTGTGAEPMRSVSVAASSMSWPSVAMTRCTNGTSARSMLRHALTAAGPMMTVDAPTVTSSRVSSGAGLDGFSGTATAPRPTMARYDTTKKRLLPTMRATRSPCCTPSSVSPPRRPAT